MKHSFEKRTPYRQIVGKDQYKEWFIWQCTICNSIAKGPADATQDWLNRGKLCTEVVVTS